MSDIAAPAPRANPDLLGQELAERVLLRAQASGRLPHAWLLTGPRGVGKATLAFRFARFLLDRRDAEADLFGGPPDSLAIDPESDVFRRVASGGDLDLRTLERVVDPKSGKPRRQIAVEDVRKAVDFLRMTSAGGGWRIVVVDAADDLGGAAANALLKILEEPPPQALLLLVAHAPDALLPTIRSRCCHLALAALSEAQVVGLLRRYAPELAQEDATALARLSEGSIGRALDLAAGGGLELYREMIALLDALPHLDAVRLQSWSDRLAKGADGAAFRTGSELLTWWLARLVRAGARGEIPPEVVAGEGALMSRLLLLRELALWIGLWEKVTQLFARAEGASLDRKQVALTALLEVEALCVQAP